MTNTLTKNIGPSFRILQLNVEGILQSKCDYIARLAKEHKIDIICLQETHLRDISKINSRATISGYKILAYNISRIHGSIAYAELSLHDIKAIFINETNGIELIQIKLENTHITTVYKPPNSNWAPHVLPMLSHPAIYIGDLTADITHRNMTRTTVKDVLF